MKRDLSPSLPGIYKRPGGVLEADASRRERGNCGGGGIINQNLCFFFLLTSVIYT